MQQPRNLEQLVRTDDRHVIHGYTTVFWWCAGIFAAGAIICGALLRPGPLTGPEDIPARKPSLQAAPARS